MPRIIFISPHFKSGHSSAAHLSYLVRYIATREGVAPVADADRLKPVTEKQAQMLEDVKHLKTILDELEDPLERFDEKLFAEVVKAISIDPNDEMTLTVIGGLRFTELI